MVRKGEHIQTQKNRACLTTSMIVCGCFLCVCCRVNPQRYIALFGLTRISSKQHFFGGQLNACHFRNLHTKHDSTVCVLRVFLSLIRDCCSRAFQIHNSTDSSVVLENVNLSTSGRFRCEVSGEAPSFQTVSDHGDMIVVGEFSAWALYILSSPIHNANHSITEQPFPKRGLASPTVGRATKSATRCASIAPPAARSRPPI